MVGMKDNSGWGGELEEAVEPKYIVWHEGKYQIINKLLF